MFDLSTASKELQAVAKSYGIEKGKWEPVNTGIPVFELTPDTVVANIVGNGKSVEVTAGDIMSVPPLVGIKETALILGWGKAKVSEYLRRGKLPHPVQRLASGPVWRKSDIEKFKQSLTPKEVE